MKELTWFVVLFVISVGLVASAPGEERASTCTDRYIWIADGSVECKYLYTESYWGMHGQPSYWCNDYALTECCETCRSLRAEGIVN